MPLLRTGNTRTPRATVDNSGGEKRHIHEYEQRLLLRPHIREQVELKRQAARVPLIEIQLVVMARRCTPPRHASAAQTVCPVHPQEGWHIQTVFIERKNQREQVMYGRHRVGWEGILL